MGPNGHTHGRTDTHTHGYTKPITCTYLFTTGVGPVVNKYASYFQLP